ncbi:MAG TPA: hypothetical protein VH650_12325 [Gaiellaceae bacterium]
MSAEEPTRPGLVEVLIVWGMFGVVTAEVLIAYARLPVHDLYHVSETGLAGGAGRSLVFVNYPTALVAIGILVVVAQRLRRRWATVCAVAGAVLCAVVAWPGVVEQADLDAKPANALAGIGVAIALVLTCVSLVRDGVGGSAPFGGWDRVRIGFAVVLLFAALPWIAAENGFSLESVPGLGSLYMTSEVFPEPGQPDMLAVHYGHHHGMDGTLLALTAVVLSRVLPSLRGRGSRVGFGLFLSLMFVYGLTNAVQDFWYEQLVKRGALEARIPSVIVPALTPAWLAILVAAVLIYFLARFVVKGGPTRQEGAV